ncbi:hypothetical protein BVX99_03110 [bacterium F16]|nr:hypothetical protein BVX99_03110 [bacterium F16]
MKNVLFLIILMFLSSCATKNASDQFLEAVKNGDYAKLQNIITSSGKKYPLPVEEGDSPLHLAAKTGNIESVRYLVEAGLFTNSSNFRKSTALHEASYCGYSDIVEILVKHGANLNVNDKYNETPLMLGIGRLPLSTIKLMVTKGAKAGKNKSIINNALHTQNYELLDFLIDHGFSTKKPYRFGMDSLTYAISLGDTKLVKYLFTKGAKLESVENLRDSWYFSCYDRTDLINLVMENRISRKQYDSITSDEFVYRLAIMKDKQGWTEFFKRCGTKAAPALPMF